MESGLHGSVIAVAAFAGWNDAGTASTAALTHLLNLYGINEHAPESIVDANRYVDFQINRPQVSRGDDGSRLLTWPDTHVVPLRSPGDPSVVAVYGPEPSFNWRGYCREVLNHLRERKVTKLIVLGSLLADTPHSRPLPISVRDVSTTAAEFPAEDTLYEGPVGIPTVLAEEAAASGLQTVSVWVQVPNYVGQDSVPKATLALVRALEAEIGTAIDTSELADEADAWEAAMDELAVNESDVGAYVEQLEAIRDAADMPEATGEAIASEFEQFLRRRGDN